MKELFSEGFIFQQDGSPVHRAEMCLRYINKNIPQTLIRPEWLNPIENVWGWLKNKVNKDLPQTVDALKKSIKHHWKSVDEEFFTAYYESIRDVMEAVIQMKAVRLILIVIIFLYVYQHNYS